ncbi:META domain-containing protein [Halpernia frigidisoli]|uniref:Heat shock protein HslJ n=1 Tax=Halpernia frigidisoli TaxID=1125876 RepID=A0A1I3D7I0_9FLAO|nr:META domain-containing protein [Halpernia frigidisoli]SFH82647.1 Heat shock protein HslJ [Halpernia frigidisoli]
MKNILLAFCAVILLASCSSVNGLKSKSGASQASLNNSSWTLATEVKGTAPTLLISGDRISGNAGCNNYFSTEINLDPTAGNFSVKNIGSTRKMCDNMDVETNFLKMLDATTKYVVKDNVLELYKDNLLLLRFNKM